MSKKYGIMLIGCGHIGEEHMSDIYYRDNVNIVAVIDDSIEKAKLFAKKYNARYCDTDYLPYLNNDDVDIVIIATYTDSHYSILLDCLKANKHVLCEKPIACDLETGVGFYNAVKHSKSKVLIAHILRHNKTYQRAAEIIHSGTIGDIKLFRMVQNHHAKNWDRYKRLLSDCSPITDCGVHYIDVIQWFTDSKVCEVGGFSAKIDADSPRDNYGMLQMKLENGSVGYYEVVWSPNSSSQNLKEFIGEKGRLSIELMDNRFDNREEGDKISLYHSETNTYETINIESKYKDMYNQLSNLIDMIENDTEANPTIDDVFSAFYVAMEADRAIASKQVIIVDAKAYLEKSLRDLDIKVV